MKIAQPTLASGLTSSPHLDPLCRRASLGMAVLAAIWMLPSEVLLANPNGGAVVGGSATITQTPGVTTINQSSSRAVINWQDFSIGNGELTQFNQPGRSSIALNRVTGKNPSNILGQLKANGNVWLVNRNGILFGPNARVNVQGLLATTADITDQNFLAGHGDFSIPSPNPDASVVNQGSITIGEYGLGGLVAPHVRNSGIITGRLSQVVIAGTPTFALDYYGDGLIQFAATSKVSENADPSQPLVKNDGHISVDGGDILITADAAAEVVDEVINTGGVIEARSITEKGGVIVLNGGDAGLVHVAGALDASSQDAGITGGSVDVLGNRVLVADGAHIDASGPAGGGVVHVGGDLHGEGELPTASKIIVMPEAQITADATEAGNGGQVIVWADDSASINGKISARGGPVSGNGGMIETSGKNHLELTSSPDASSPNGTCGTWLIDPANITIVAAGYGGAIDTTEVYAGLISAALNDGTNVTLDTSNFQGDELGNITQESGATISKVQGTEATLTLNASNTIILNDTITSYNGEEYFPLNVILNADRDANGAGAIAITGCKAGCFIDVDGDVILGGGANPLTSPAFGTEDHTAGISIDGGTFGGGIFSGTGSISLTGRGYAGLVDYSWGIALYNNASIESIHGNIDLTGVGGGDGTSAYNSGILLSDASIASTGSGNITLTGTGGAGTNGNAGISLFLGINGDTITSAGGDIKITGIGGGNSTGEGNRGVDFAPDSSFSVATTGGGTISIVGTGGAGINSTQGIYLNGGEISAESGNVILDATPGEAGLYSVYATNAGINTSGTTTLVAGSGDIDLQTSNDFGKVIINSARNVNLFDVDGIELGTSVLSGDLSLHSDTQLFGEFNSSGIFFSGPVATGGDMYLDALGDISQAPNAHLIANNLMINAPIDAFGNVRLDAGNRIVNLKIAGLSDGEGGFGSFGEVVFNNDESLTVSGVSNLDTLKLTVNGELVLAGPISTSDNGTSILIDTQSFTNIVGSGALVTGEGGRYLVFSQDPANDSRNLPSDEFEKRYNFPFNPDDPDGAQANPPLPAEDNFFLYAVAPTLFIIADNVTRMYGDPNPVLTYTYSGLIDDDSLSDVIASEPMLGTSVNETSGIGTYSKFIKIVAKLNEEKPPLGYMLQTVDGDFTVTPASLGTCEICPTIPINTDVHIQPDAPHLLTSDHLALYSVSKMHQVRESDGLLLSPDGLLLSNDGNREPDDLLFSNDGNREPDDLLFSNDGNRELWGL